MPKRLHVIVACSENRAIGRHGKLPWHIPEDLHFFHAQTAGQICVLGRICYETWPRAQRDGRRPIVLTSQPPESLKSGTPTPITSETSGRDEDAPPPAPTAELTPPILVSSLTAALEIAENLPGEIYICGGQRIYEETLTLSGRPLRLHLTLIHANVTGDTFFPEWRHVKWTEISRKDGADANARYTFLTLDRAEET
jgi:dihydrofolate reductase